MEENQNEDQFLDKYTKEKVAKGITELLEEKELKIQWHKEIAESQSIQTFFENYNPNSVQSFIDGFINKKYQVHRHADMFSRIAEEKRSRWINKAHEHLGYILQKKLFDLQCLWRANQIKLEGINISWDFDMWRDNIMNCPFLEPITKEEIERYQAFLQQDEDYYEFNDVDCQDYDQIKAEYNGNDEDYCIMPDWYEYHNLVTGNSSLLLLPDTRGEKEDFYISLNNKKVPEKIPPVAPVAPVVIDPRPSLNWFGGKDTEFFVKTFEDRDTQLKFENYQEGHRVGRSHDIDYDILFMDMLEEEENIPVDAHYDFKEAVKKGFIKFRNNKIAEHLPLAHEQYLFNKKMGFKTEYEGDSHDDFRKRYLEDILDGREANGEPRDLNF